MGGRVALTVRASEAEQWRGSCWTNALPDGLFAAEFYVDLESSRRHAWDFVQRLLAARRDEPRIEELWGGHGMCAPTGYGIVVVDYVSSTLVSAQGYCAVDSILSFDDYERAAARWKRLEGMGLLLPHPDPLFDPNGPGVPAGWRIAGIRLPFEHRRVGHEGSIDQAMADWADRTLGLSDEERASWAAWLAERAT